eukprot:4937659-Karenia_brevis.AAC.1
MEDMLQWAGLGCQPHDRAVPDPPPPHPAGRVIRPKRPGRSQRQRVRDSVEGPGGPQEYQ